MLAKEHEETLTHLALDYRKNAHKPVDYSLWKRFTALNQLKLSARTIRLSDIQSVSLEGTIARVLSRTLEKFYLFHCEPWMIDYLCQLGQELESELPRLRCCQLSFVNGRPTEEDARKLEKSFKRDGYCIDRTVAVSASFFFACHMIGEEPTDWSSDTFLDIPMP